jgi:hypothetical protein
MRTSAFFAFACLGVLCFGCGQRPRQSETDHDEPITAKNHSIQRIRSAERLRDQRAVVEKFLTDEFSRQKYRTAAGKLGTIRTILQAHAFKPNQTCELQCLGIVLGDAFVQELKMEWVMVEDDGGRDPSVQPAGTTIILYPLTMISKRVE